MEIPSLNKIELCIYTPSQNSELQSTRIFSGPLCSPADVLQGSRDPLTSKPAKFRGSGEHAKNKSGAMLLS